MATNSDDQRKLKPKPAEESQQKASHRPHGVHKRLKNSLMWLWKAGTQGYLECGASRQG